MNKTELFFFIYYGTALQFFIFPIAGNQVSIGAGLPQMFSDGTIVFLRYIGTVLFSAPLCVGSYFVVKSWLAGRVKI